MWKALLLGAGTGLLQGASAQSACSTSTLASAAPTNTALALRSYSYCGGTLTADAYIENVDYDKVVTLYYTNALGKSTPLSVVGLGYQSSIDNNYEIWNTVTPDVNLDGITKLLNITYQATDVGQTYVQQLNTPVVASGAPPTAPTPPKPYATPRGFQSDITSWLAASRASQAYKAVQYMFANIEVTNAGPGTIVAAQSYANPDYGYNWVRDSSLTMDVVASLYAGANNTVQKSLYATLFSNYAIARATEQNDPNLQTGLGEPKFNLDNSVFTGPWGRPQNDGPATAAIAMMEFSNTYLAQGGKKSYIKSQFYDSASRPQTAPVMRDLLFIAANWSSPSFDLWEEEESDHFYTRMVQHRAMVMGAAFARNLGDGVTAQTCTTAANAIAKSLDQFWDPIRNLILYEYGPVLRGKYTYKDIAVNLALIHGYAGDGIYGYDNDRVLVTTWQIATSFLDVFPIASKHTAPQGGILGIPIGRYPEDTYDGIGTSSLGNPWYLCTSAMSETFYRMYSAFQTAGAITVTNTSMPFWAYFSPQTSMTVGTTYASSSSQYKSMMTSLSGWGDAFMRTIKFYTPASGHMPEEINRSTGTPQGAIDLTWSYAGLLTAAFARAEAMGNGAYIGALADLPVSTNKTQTARAKSSSSVSAGSTSTASA